MGKRKQTIFKKRWFDITTLVCLTVENRIRNQCNLSFLFYSVGDPGSVANPDPGLGAFLTPGSGISDPGWEKVSIRIRDPG